MDPKIKISLVITTYNWPEALDFVLRSVEQQTDKNFEVIVADDGSKQETTDLVNDHMKKSSLSIKHYWHKDDEFRVAAARNGAVDLSTGEYIIFIDGDCCLMPSFISSHRNLAEKGWLVAGRRVYLKRGFTTKMLEKRWDFFRWSRAGLFIMGLTGQCNRPFQFLPLRQSDEKRKKQADSWDKVQTCNLGVWRDDFYNVDGFDENYVGHGLEDSDFTLRLIRSGIKRITANHSSPVLHLFHSRSIPERADKACLNPKRFQSLLESDRHTAVLGISSRKNS
ncbi:glycosyltransferase family 2 protein [Kiloniella antarctica]|uniref:Glycosyltransferase family 2 protein n=1 Tax=Kiloniella antarctica TaxID=1550907 RepID=A0ABW5BFG2_9PROT